MAPPITVITPSSRNTSPRTEPAFAPRAMRTPISRVRCATEYASTPYRPIAASSVATSANATVNVLIMRSR